MGSTPVVAANIMEVMGGTRLPSDVSAKVPNPSILVQEQGGLQMSE